MHLTRTRVIVSLALLLACFLIAGSWWLHRADTLALSSAQFLEQLKKNAAPKGSRAFVPLTDPGIQQIFLGLTEDMLRGQSASADQRIKALEQLGVRYQRITVMQDQQQPIVGFIERVVPGDADYHGWGTVLLKPSKGCHTIYQAPHLIADQWTEEITLQAFMLDPGACAAMFAGTHRYANGLQKPDSDPAHADNTLFQALTEFFAHRGQALGRPYWFVQFHGSTPQDGMPAMIISNGAPKTTPPPSVLMHIYQQVNQEANVRIGVCGWFADGGETERYNLCARDNIQGQLLETLGLRYTFIHIEIDQYTRSDYHSATNPTAILDLLQALREQLE